MRLCKLRSFRDLPLELRDGLLAQTTVDHNASTAMKEQVETSGPTRRAGRPTLWRGPDVCAAHSRSSLELFRRRQAVHQLPPESRHWLEAAATPTKWALTSIAPAGAGTPTTSSRTPKIFGYTPLERRIIAAIARFVGKFFPSSRIR